MTQRRAVGALEAEVMAALWASAEPMTPADVVAAMDRPPAYTTIMTVLTRLWQKKLVARTVRGRAFEYRPTLNEAEFAARKMRASLEAASNREAALSHFVGTLTKRDERALRRIVDELNR